MATGVASSNAHGQLITRTEIALDNAKLNSAPQIIQTKNVIAEIKSTDGTKIPETLSAVFAIGAFVAEASLTSFIICESAVSSPFFLNAA